MEKSIEKNHQSVRYKQGLLNTFTLGNTMFWNQYSLLIQNFPERNRRVTFQKQFHTAPLR